MDFALPHASSFYSAFLVFASCSRYVGRGGLELLHLALAGALTTCLVFFPLFFPIMGHDHAAWFLRALGRIHLVAMAECCIATGVWLALVAGVSLLLVGQHTSLTPFDSFHLFHR